MTKLSGTMSDDLIPSFDQQLHNNYCSTTYTCQNFRIQPGYRHSEFIDFLLVNEYCTYAFITAYNPYSLARTSDASNQNRNRELMADLSEKDLTFLPAVANDNDRIWPMEPGFFLFNTNLEEALQLATRFQQNAILWGTTESLPRILWTHGKLASAEEGA